MKIGTLSSVGSCLTNVPARLPRIDAKRAFAQQMISYMFLLAEL